MAETPVVPIMAETPEDGMSPIVPEPTLHERRRDALRSMLSKSDGLHDPRFHGFALSQLAHIALDQDYLLMRLTLAIEDLTAEITKLRKR